MIWFHRVGLDKAIEFFPNIEPENVFINIEMPEGAELSGIVITKISTGSPAWNAGLREGDIITTANRKPVNTLKALKKAAANDRQLLLNIRRGNNALFLLLQ